MTASRTRSIVSGVQRAWRIALLIARCTRAYEASPVAVLGRAVDLHRRLEFQMDEVATIGLLDPAVPRSTLDDLRSRKRIRPLQTRLNPRELWPLTENKAVFHHVCAAAGLPVPALYAVVSRGGGGWTADGESPCGEDAWAAALARVLPTDFVSKPVHGHFGIGVRAFRREGLNVYEHNHEEAQDFRELHRTLVSDTRFDAFLLQERVRNCDEIERLCGTRTLQTVRVITLVENGGAAALAACWKVVTGDELVDNFRDGATGNGLCSIDLDHGTLEPALIPRGDGLGLLRLAAHPRTGAAIDGFRLPFWTETIELVRDAASTFAWSRALAWDVGLAPGGPILIEANALWGPMNEFEFMPALVRRLEEAAGNELAKGDD